MNRTAGFLTLLTALWAVSSPPAGAQGATVAFGGIKSDTTLPVEVTADQLEVNQTDGTAIFTGNVIVLQGDMRMSAAAVRVEYAKDDRTKIDTIHATGGVTLTSPTEAAEGREAVYTVASGEVVMTGDVLLTQGGSTIAGQKLIVDLDTGTGRMDGRVKTVIDPKAKK
jgi:lipopolysaccharide export system protein LptA